MRRTKSVIAHLVFMFVFFDLLYGEKVKKSSTKFISDTSNLSFVSTLKKKLENYTSTEYNIKKKNLKTSISSNVNIDKLNIEDKKSSYLHKPYAILKNDTSRVKPSNIMYIKKNRPYVSNKNFYNERKENKLGNIAYSFIEDGISQLVDAKVSNDYNNLMNKLHESYNKGRDVQIKIYSYKQTMCYFINEGSSTYNDFMAKVVRPFTDVNRNTQKYMSYCTKSKDDIRKKMNELEELAGNPKEADKFTKELEAFKSNIEKITEKLDKDLMVIEEKNMEVYSNLDKCLCEEHCKTNNCESAKNIYRASFNNYYRFVSDNSNNHNEKSKEYEDFLNFDTKLLQIKNKDFYQKKHKYTLKLLIEEINDIIKISKENHNLLSEQLKLFNNANSKIEETEFDKSSLLKTIFFPVYVGHMYARKGGWFKLLDSKFSQKKKAIYDLFDEIAKELFNEIKSLTYPSEVESESSEIFLKAQKTVNDIDDNISEHCEILEDLSYSYSNSEIFTIKNELTKLYAEIVTSNIIIKGEFHLISEKYNSIKSEKDQVETLKNGVLKNKEQKFDNITDNDINTKKTIENTIALANDKLQAIKKDEQKLNEHKSKIEELFKDIIIKKERMKTLENQEDEKKEQTTREIKGELKQIEEKMSKLKTFMDLKDKKNDDLKFVEEVIEASSCDNKHTYMQRKEQAKEQMESALISLFNDGKIEKIYNEIPNYVSEKKRLSYAIYDLSTINGILTDLKEKSREIDKIIHESETTMDDKVTNAKNNFTQLRYSIITDSIDDLHNKMKISFEAFNSTLKNISEDMEDYEKKKEKLINCEEEIVKKKCEFLDKFVEADCEELKGKDTFQETMNLKEVVKQNKKSISTKISNGKMVICTIKEQFELYNKIEKYFAHLENVQHSENLKSLKRTINDMDVDKKINDCETSFDSTTNSIENSIKKVALSKKIIEDVKILNKVINESNKNNESITNLRSILRELEDKINTQSDSIKCDNLIKEDVKGRLIGILDEQKEKLRDKTKRIDASEKKSNDILQSYVNLKGTIDNSIEQNTEDHSQNISNNKEKLEPISKEISALTKEITTSRVEIDNLINNQNNEIVDIIYTLIIELNKEINSKVKKSLEILETTEKSFYEYKIEKDLDNMNNDINKETLRILSQNFNSFKDDINTQKIEFVKIQDGAKGEFLTSDNIKKDIEKSNSNRSSIKSSYEKIKKILDDYNVLEIKLQSSLEKINENKVKYKITLVSDYHDKITDEKKKGEEEIRTIDMYKEKIEELKIKIPDNTDCALENFNYKDYADNSKKCQEKIDRLEQEVSELRKGIPQIKEVDKMHDVQVKVEQNLKEVVNEKSSIGNALVSIKHMQKMLTLTKLSIVVEDIEKNVQKVKEEEENAEEKFKESERTKKKLLSDLKNASKLKDLFIHNLDEDSINKSIEEIGIINSRIVSNIKYVNVLLTEAEKYKEDSFLYFNNVVRGKDNITFLKKHDEEKKNVNEKVEEDVNKYIVDSKYNSDKADAYAQEISNIYKLSLHYGEEMKAILDDSLILAENMKVNIKKNEAIDILIEIQNNYYDNKYILERVKERLLMLKNEVSHMKNEDEANNSKSINAFTQIEIMKSSANSNILYIEEITDKTLQILNSAETELDEFIKESEQNYEKSSDKLQMEQGNLKKVLELFNEFENKKNQFKIESSKLTHMNMKVRNMESKMEMSKRLYEEGILEEIKKIADQEKKIIEFLKESMENAIDTSIAFMKDSVLGSEIIIQKFDEPKISMNEKYDSFDKSYKEIEKEARNILETSNTYKSMKEKRKRAKIEKIKLEELNIEMNQLLNSIKYIKTTEILRLIVYLKKELDKVYGAAQEEHIIMKELTEGIRKNVENTINATGVDIALNELDDAKNKFNAFKKSKITHTSYRYNAYSIYVDINKDMEFIDMDIKTIAALHGYEDMENVEEILLIIQGDSHDIDNKERENEENIMYIKDLYEQVRVRENIKKNIKDKINEINALLQDAQDSLSSYKKIKEINVDINDYGKNVKNSKQYENFIKKSSSYEKTYNKMKIDLKIEEIKSELNTSKKTLNDLEELIEGANVVEFTSKILERAKENMNTVIDKINKANNNILGIHASLTELIELRRKCKLYFLHLVITSINTKITKDAILFEKRKKNIIELMEYVIYTYDSINKDIDMTNKCFSQRMIKSYDSNNVDSLNKLVEDFKRRELKVMERISDIKKAFVESNKRRDSIYIDESLHKLKHVYNEFKKEKKYLNKIYKKMSEIELKERDNSAAKYIYISESYEQLIEKERKKILDNKSKLEEMESFIRKDSQKLLSMEHIDTNEKNTQKFKASYEAIMNKVKNIEKLENKNNKAKIKLTNHFPQICYLIDRTKGLLKETELYEHEIDYDLSKKENMEILYEVHNYIKSTEIKIEESKRILEELRNRIEQNKQYVHENDITIHSIYYMLSKVNNIKENYKIEIEENKERNPNEINTIKNKKSVINNNIDNYFKFDMMNNVSLEKNKFGNSKFKLTVGILIGLLIFYVGVMLIIHKKKNMKKEVTKEICKEYEESKNVRDLDKKEVIDVSFFGQ